MSELQRKSFEEWFFSEVDGSAIAESLCWQAWQAASVVSDRLACAALARNAELVAQVAGRDALLNNLSKWINQLPVPTKSATSWLIRIDGVMKETPAQGLCKIKSQVIEQAVLATKTAMREGGQEWLCRVDSLLHYAAQVKAGKS